MVKDAKYIILDKKMFKNNVIFDRILSKDGITMKDVLLEKIKYLLNYKLTTDNKKVEILVESIMYSFLANLEKKYNVLESRTKYYNFLLNKLYGNIKSIIIPAPSFNYHQLGFLELATDLNDKFNLYTTNGIDINKELKNSILKQSYYYYLFQVLKSNGVYNGYNNREKNNYELLEKYLTWSDVIDLTDINKNYKKEYNAVYPDGTTYNYYLYTKTFITDNILNINILNILKVIMGGKEFTNGSINSDFKYLEDLDIEYQDVFAEINNSKNKYTPFGIIEDTLLKIERETIGYKKIDYYKNIMYYLLEMFNYKVTKILNKKDNEELEKVVKDISIIECNLLYNQDIRLNNSLNYIKVLKRIKLKISNYKKNNNKNIEKEYLVFSNKDNKEEKVKSSVQPIKINNQYVVIHILDIQNIENRVLIKINIEVVDYDTLAKKIYDNLYITLKELKHLFSSNDLGFVSKESDIIRKGLANRIINPTIMEIIRNERNNYLGEFVYSKEEDRCIIYKNRSIEELLEEVI